MLRWQRGLAAGKQEECQQGWKGSGAERFVATGGGGCVVGQRGWLQRGCPWPAAVVGGGATVVAEEGVAVCLGGGKVAVAEGSVGWLSLGANLLCGLVVAGLGSGAGSTGWR